MHAHKAQALRLVLGGKYPIELLRSVFQLAAIMAKSSKCLRTAGKVNRPPKKRLNFSMDNDDFMELSSGFVLKETTSDT